MAATEPALPHVAPGAIHALAETCPTCDQPIPNERAEEVFDRVRARERSVAKAAESRAREQMAVEKAGIESAARARVEMIQKEKKEALQKAAAERTLAVDAARAEARKAATAALQQEIAATKQAKVHAERSAAERIAEADTEKENALARLQALKDERAQIEAAANARVEKLRKDHDEAMAKAAAEKASLAATAQANGRREAEAALQDQVAAAQKAQANAEKTAAQQLADADAEKKRALEQLQTLKSEYQDQVEQRVLEVRTALEKDKAEAIATAKAASDRDARKLTAKLETLQRQLEKQRADVLGEGAEVNLFDALKTQFPNDNIRRVPKGVSGADILHTVINNGQDCGTIIYDSKNSTAWRNEYVAKLVRDQTAAKADHAILATFKFPEGTSQVEVRQGVVVVNPARAVAIASIVRKHLLLLHTLRLSRTERTKKTVALYDFVTSERCALLLANIDTASDSLLDLQATEIRAHRNHWKKEGMLVRSIQKAKADLDVEIESIIGTRQAEE